MYINLSVMPKMVENGSFQDNTIILPEFLSNAWWVVRCTNSIFYSVLCTEMSPVIDIPIPSPSPKRTQTEKELPIGEI